MITLYGIKNCDTVKRSRKALDQAALEYRFHDFRADGAPREEISRWINILGDQLINKRGTTWRQLSKDEQAQAESAPLQLLCDKPSLIKRPVIAKDGELRLGFAAKDADEMLAWLKQ